MTRQNWNHLAIALLATALMLATAACASAPLIPQTPMPAGASFTGLWYSNYDDMQLVQQGDKVSGTFEYKTGGQLSGTLQGGVLHFDWVQIGDLSVGRREVKGKGYFIMGKDGQHFEGKWGYEDSLSNGGSWTGDKAAQDYTK